MSQFNKDAKITMQYNFILSSVATSILFFALMEFFPVFLGWFVAGSCIVSAVVHACGFYNKYEMELFTKMHIIWSNKYARKGLVIATTIVWAVILMAAQIPTVILAIAFLASSIDAVIKTNKVQ